MGKTENLTKTWAVGLLAFISCALWGSAFSAVKRSYELLGIASDDWASQLVFGGLRFCAAGIMVLVFASAVSRQFLLPTRQNLPKICVIGFFQTVMQYFCYYIGLAHTSGVRASVLVGVNVFMAIHISAMLRLERLTLRKVLGSVIGFAGILVINLGGLASGSPFRFLGEGMILLCTAASGFSSAFMKKFSDGENPVLMSGWQFLLGGLVLTGIGIPGGGRLSGIGLPALLLMLYLAFVSAAAYSIWALLLKHNPVSRVAVFGFLNPVCGVMISVAVLKEAGQINIGFLAALLLVCIGIVTVNTSGCRTGEKR